jgi:hypothetical protein
MQRLQTRKKVGDPKYDLRQGFHRNANLNLSKVKEKLIRSKGPIDQGLCKFLVWSDQSPGTCKAECGFTDVTYFFLGGSSYVP